MGNKCNCKCIQDTLNGENDINTINNHNNQQTLNKEGSLSTNLTNLEHFETSKNDEKKLKAGKKPNKNIQNFNSIEENNAEYENYNSYNVNKMNENNNNNNNQFNYDYYNNDNINVLDFNNTNNNNNNNFNNSNTEYILNSNLYTNKTKNDLPNTSSNNVESQVIKSTMFYDKQNDENNEKNSQSMNKILDETADAHLSPADDFSKYIFNKINDIRQNPQKYISVLEDAKNNIVIDKKSGKLIYKSPNSKVKVAMNRGVDAFDEAIMFLNNLEPMHPLIYHPLITINVPDNEIDLKNKEYLKDEVSRIESKNIYIKSYFRDIVKEPETCFILMIADDSSKNSGMKRKDILDRNKKYIGIVSKKIEKSFACYITFADNF